MVTSQQNNVAATARAFATYALVPYLGILFCPGALVMGTVGVFNSCRVREGNTRNSVMLVVIAAVELGAQLTLWWIMYKVPQWSTRR